jgi:regulator of sigma E protease
MGGIVSIVQVTSQASAIGIATLFSLMALISVNLGVLNLLPIPALDGGHIMFNLYEMITRKAPTERVFYYMTIGGWMLLLSLMLFTTYNDILRIIKG